MSVSLWKTVDLKAIEIPTKIIAERESVKVTEAVKQIDDAEVFYREALPEDPSTSKPTLLMMHGKMFSSKTWLDLGTIQIVAAMGYHVIAIDIPGYGNSPAATIPNRGLFVKSVIESFNISKPVIVSPSLSGFFTLPFLLKHCDMLAGYVPVAPVGIECFQNLPRSDDESIIKSVYGPLKMLLPRPLPDVSQIKTPTLVVFGEKDRSLSSALLSLLPNSQCQEIPNGSHPAYLDNPDLWHKLLYNFLHHLSTAEKV